MLCVLGLKFAVTMRLSVRFLVGFTGRVLVEASLVPQVWLALTGVLAGMVNLRV